MPVLGVWVRRALTAAALVLAAVFVGLGAVGGAWYWNDASLRAAQQTRAQLAPMAAEAVPQIFGFDYQTVETSMIEVYPLLTPQFRTDFEKQAQDRIIPEARQRKAVSQVNVVGQGVVDAQRRTGSVLVYLNRTVTDEGKDPIVDGARVQVFYQKVDGRWLIDNIKPV
ncbi:MAG TPA: mammalian cell entry protein [Mycolicibacillus parakoreensis]|nr:mammalian cell entry protein [Mycolicibacillus parakoreensis]